MSWDVISAVAQVVTGIASLVVATVALRVSLQQLKPLRQELSKLRAEDRRRETLKEELPSQRRRLVGYDPRFTSRDWSQLLSPGDQMPAPLVSRLSATYSEFHRGLTNALPSDGIVIVDLLFVPNLLQRGLIAPLAVDNGLDLEAMLERRADLLGVKLEPPAIAMMRRLCSDDTGVVGALPLWINTHGRIVPEVVPVQRGRRLGQIATFEQLLHHEESARLLGDAGVQSYYLVFELLAHLAYRDCRLFHRVGDKSYSCDLLHEANGARRRFAEAVADLAVRLQLYSGTRERFVSATRPDDLMEENAFRVEHAGDARSLKEKVALWKPVFSSELLWRALPQRNTTPLAALANESEFLPPFARHGARDTALYLSALGGYGLALPSAARGDSSSQRALRYAFLSNPLLMHPYVNDMLPPDSDGSAVAAFVDRHSRPRWPFWPEVEQALTEVLLDLLLALPRGGRGPEEPAELWSEYARLVAESGSARRLVADFLQRVSEVFDRNPGWTLHVHD